MVPQDYMNAIQGLGQSAGPSSALSDMWNRGGMQPTPPIQPHYRQQPAVSAMPPTQPQPATAPPIQGQPAPSIPQLLQQRQERGVMGQGFQQMDPRMMPSGPQRSQLETQYAMQQNAVGDKQQQMMQLLQNRFGLGGPRPLTPRANPNANLKPMPFTGDPRMSPPSRRDAMGKRFGGIDPRIFIPGLRTGGPPPGDPMAMMMPWVGAGGNKGLFKKIPGNVDWRRYRMDGGIWGPNRTAMA